MRIKICGITKAEQGKAIATLGVTALGFICVPTSPRYVTAAQIRVIVEQLPKHIDRIGVFANAKIEEICQVIEQSNLNGVQLHGNETPEFCQKLRQSLTEIEIIKAFRIKTIEDLSQVEADPDNIDTILLDAYHPQKLGGTGKTIDWSILQDFHPSCPWFLAGGLNPDNVIEAISQVKPNGIDISSGVEASPGDKNLDQVAQLMRLLIAIK